MFRNLLPILILTLTFATCKKRGGTEPAVPVNTNFRLTGNTLNNSSAATQFGVPLKPTLRLVFNAPAKRSSISTGVNLRNSSGLIPVNAQYQNNDSVVLIQPVNNLTPLTRYTFEASILIQSAQNVTLQGSGAFYTFNTGIDSSRKFPALTDDALLNLVQQQTFKYFWDFAHPVSGLSRERNTSGDLVTSGGSGFGIMTIPIGIQRNFITRSQGLARMQTVVGFLKNTAQTFHGAYPHWLNGNNGAVIPFSAKDNGADLVETSFLMAGLLSAREYFTDAGTTETNLRIDIDTLFNRVEWNWFRKNNENVLYWHWSPNFTWDMNLPIRGWNECLITYILGASSTTYGIPATVYQNGFKNSNTYSNGNSYYGYPLPLGEARGGPLFFSHYSFLGINPNGLSESGVNFKTQNTNHTLINYEYCKANPLNHYGYSDSVWGLTASDIENGYTASSPSNDVSVIAPTAALSSFPYTPQQSMAALKFYYYVLGDKLWKEYGFVDAFSLKNNWFASSFLAIDQGPIVIMIENHRTQLIWNLLTSNQKVKAGMLSLGFTAPYL